LRPIFPLPLPLFRLPRRASLPAVFYGPHDETAVFLFQLVKAWERRRHAQVFRSTREGAGHEGVDGVVEELPSQPAQDELGEGFFGVGWGGGYEGLLEESKLGAPGEQVRLQEGGGAQRQSSELAPAHDVALIGDFRNPLQAVGEPEVDDELAQLRRGVENAVGAALDEEPVSVTGPDRAAGAIGVFQDVHLQAVLAEKVRRCQSGDAGAYDDYVCIYGLDVMLLSILCAAPLGVNFALQYGHWGQLSSGDSMGFRLLVTFATAHRRVPASRSSIPTSALLWSEPGWIGGRIQGLFHHSALDSAQPREGIS